MADELKDKVADPQAHFDKPKDVCKDGALSHDEKTKALDNWEQDERQLMTASNEGMPGGDEGVQKADDNLLGDVIRAKEKIGEEPNDKPSH